MLAVWAYRYACITHFLIIHRFLGGPILKHIKMVISLLFAGFFLLRDVFGKPHGKKVKLSMFLTN
jgi:hypothetical protein